MKPASIASSSLEMGHDHLLCQAALDAQQTVDRFKYMHGMRMVRAWSAIERLMDCRIHQVA
jgi:hypothetical protein